MNGRICVASIPADMASFLANRPRREGSLMLRIVQALRTPTTICGVLLATGAWADPGCARVVITADPDYPPLHWYDGTTLRGASVELTERVFADLGVAVTTEYVGPLSRVLLAAQNGSVDVVATLKDTPERRKYLDYPTTPAFDNPVAVFVPVTHPFPYHGWSDLVGKLGGTIQQNMFGGGFDEYAQAKLDISAVPTIGNVFNMLSAGRVDYVITGLYAGTAELAMSKRTDMIVPLKPYVTDIENYVTFVRTSPCQRYLTAFDRRLKELVNADAVRPIVESNLEEWRRRLAF